MRYTDSQLQQALLVATDEQLIAAAQMIDDEVSIVSRTYQHTMLRPCIDVRDSSGWVIVLFDLQLQEALQASEQSRIRLYVELEEHAVDVDVIESSVEYLVRETGTAQ